MENEVLPAPTPEPKTSGYKIILYIVGGLILLGSAVFAGILIGKKSLPVAEINPGQISVSPTQPSGKEHESVPPDPTSQTTAVDETWNLYTNYKLGFSIKIPKAASEYSGKCIDGKLEPGMVPVTTFDDDMGTYVTYEYFHEYPVNKECKKITNNLNVIDQRANQWKTGENKLYVPGNWHIITAKIENDTELDNFVKSNWGSGCQVGEKTLTPSGDYDVKVLRDGLDLSVSKCPINFLLAFKYSPTHKIAATWGIGQAIVFSSSDYAVSYDADMVNSFKFVGSN